MVLESLQLAFASSRYLLKNFRHSPTPQANLEVAHKHQLANPRATFGVTKFMDLSQDEFAKYYLNK